MAYQPHVLYVDWVAHLMRLDQLKSVKAGKGRFWAGVAGNRSSFIEREVKQPCFALLLFYAVELWHHSGNMKGMNIFLTELPGHEPEYATM